MTAASITDESGALAHVLERTGAGNGDDAATLRVGGGLLCVSTDSCIAGVHAPTGTSPHALGRRAAARALSDLAAMGALPVGITCAVQVPPDGWDDAVAALDGLIERAREQGAELVGGDLARTPAPQLALVVTALGRRAAATGSFASRGGMRVGDELYVTGALGAATRALAAGAVTLPEPPDRLRAGVALAPFAFAMLDLSDGIARDVRNLAHASACGATVELDALPLAAGVTDPVATALGGDDYELLVALDPAHVDAAREALARTGDDLSLTRVGVATDGLEVQFTRAGAPVELAGGFVHR